ncbi:MAG: TldD/PmbA family protein [Thermoclostridium sp.]|nr:TldD/PmbA family protein [Thermoclostridium sp.]
MKTNQEIASYALEALKKAGADHAQCVVSTGKTDEFNVDGGQFSLMRSLFNSAIALKALKNGKKGVITANRLDREAVDNAVRACMAAAESSVPDVAESIAEKEKNEVFSTGVLTPDRDRLFDRLQEYMDDVKRDYPKIMIEQLVSKYTHSERVFMNTNGVEFKHTSGSYDFSTMFSAHEGEQTSSFNGYGAEFTSLDTKLIDIGMQRTLYAESEKQLYTKPYSGKFTGKLLITPACLAEILLTAFSNFIFDGTIIDGTSPWIKLLGKAVAPEILTISTCPLDSAVASGERFTADGYRSENMDIIKNGILNSFMLSNYGSRKTGYPRALNSSYNLFVKPGDKGLNEILASVDRGILLNRFSGGQPGTNGDFSGVAKNSFLIENGVITDAISETMINGNLSDLFKQVIGISSETVCDGNMVLPWMLFDGVTVTGK